MSKPTINPKLSSTRRDSGSSSSPSNSSSSSNSTSSPTAASASGSTSSAKSITQGISQLSVNHSGQRRLSTSSSTQNNHAKVTMVRRRLSVMGGAGDNKSMTKLDGAALEELKEEAAKHQVHRSGLVQRSPMLNPASPTGVVKKKRAFSCYSSLSKVGYVPFNPNKVNQDRTAEVSKFNSDEQKAFFGVFDGHGSLGHEVSQFAAQELPKYFAKQSNLDTDPSDAITKAFMECNNKLAKSSTDCTFSGTTVIVCYFSGDKIYSCNAGDSRAVLGRLAGTSPSGNAKYKEVPLSSDHKPERPDEKKRILECKGRVEACKGAKGEDIGPARVWLAHQDVPGLAMTRSFGDLIAASVGVSAKPEIWEHTVGEDDKFVIIASDGVWEFISNQEAVDIVGSHSNPEEACKVLCEEATKRWHQEEEVVDDITAVVIFL